MNDQGQVSMLFICPQARAPMKEVNEVEAIAGAGLRGDRYCIGEGSYNKGKPGNRQVTLINSVFFCQPDSQFTPLESRRNIIIDGEVEIMKAIGKQFKIGEVVFWGEKYCTTCDEPGKILRKQRSFRSSFLDRGGIIAKVVQGGTIKIRDTFVVL